MQALSVSKTLIGPQKMMKVKSLWRGDCILNGNSSNSRGVAVLLNTNFEYKILSISKDDEGNMITLDLVLGNISLKLINLYTPNRDSPHFFEKVKEIMESNNISM